MYFDCNAIIHYILFCLLFFWLTKDEMEWYRINRNDVRLILKRRIDRPNMEKLNLFKDDPIKWLTLRNCLQLHIVCISCMLQIDPLENCFSHIFISIMRKRCMFSNWKSFNFQLILYNMFDCFWFIHLEVLILRFALLFIHSLNLPVSSNRYERVWFSEPI